MINWYYSDHPVHRYIVVQPKNIDGCTAIYIFWCSSRSQAFIYTACEQSFLLYVIVATDYTIIVHVRTTQQFLPVAKILAKLAPHSTYGYYIGYLKQRYGFFLQNTATTSLLFRISEKGCKRWPQKMFPIAPFAATSSARTYTRHTYSL